MLTLPSRRRRQHASVLSAHQAGARPRSRVARLGALLVASLLLAIVATISTGVTPADALTAGAPQPVLQSNRLSGVACPTATTCYAVGENEYPVAAPVVTTVDGMVTGVQFADANTYTLKDIACATATTCYAVGESNFDPNYEAALVPITNGVVGATVPVPGTYALYHIACASATLCVATGAAAPDYAPVVVAIINGVPGTPQPAAGVGGDIDCPTATTCYTVGSTTVTDPDTGTSTTAPAVLPIVDGVVGAPQAPIVPAPGDQLYGFDDISCPSPDTCYLVGSGAKPRGDGSFVPEGVVVVVTDGVPGAIQYIPAPPPYDVDDGFGLGTIDCVSVTSCIAGGSDRTPAPGNGYLVEITNGVAGTPQPVPTTYGFNDIACPTDTSCVAVGIRLIPNQVGIVVTVTPTPPPVKPAPPADFTGDGTTDLSVYRPSNSTWYIRNGPAVTFGTSGDIPVPGDYDGNGTTDIAVFRPSTGQWFINGGPSVFFGATSDIPVPADYDGDGDADIAVFRPSTGVWYIQGGTTATWGAPGDIPEPGDYNGDRTTDIAVYRPSTGAWYVLGGTSAFWGTPGDIALPLPYAISNTYFPPPAP